MFKMILHYICYAKSIQINKIEYFNITIFNIYKSISVSIQGTFIKTNFERLVYLFRVIFEITDVIFDLLSKISPAVSEFSETKNVFSLLVPCTFISI